MAPEEVPGILPGMSQRENHPPITTPKDQDPEKGGGALLLGTNTTGGAMGQLENLSDTAPAVVIPMTGKGDKQCDRGFNGGKKIGLFW